MSSCARATSPCWLIDQAAPLRSPSSSKNFCRLMQRPSSPWIITANLDHIRKVMKTARDGHPVRQTCASGRGFAQSYSAQPSSLPDLAPRSPEHSKTRLCPTDLPVPRKEKGSFPERSRRPESRLEPTANAPRNSDTLARSSVRSRARRAQNRFQPPHGPQ